MALMRRIAILVFTYNCKMFIRQLTDLNPFTHRYMNNLSHGEHITYMNRKQILIKHLTKVNKYVTKYVSNCQRLSL